MKRKVAAAFVLGIALGSAVPVAAEFGITDTMKLGELRDVAKEILAEIRGMRSEAKAYRAQR